MFGEEIACEKLGTYNKTATLADARAPWISSFSLSSEFGINSRKRLQNPNGHFIRDRVSGLLRF